MPAAALKTLLVRLAEINNLEQAGAVLAWDQRTCMPPKGTPARARQLATLAKLSHEMFVARETQELLAAAEAQMPPAGQHPDSDERAMLRVARRNMDKATKVPTSLVLEMTETCALAEDLWQKARRENDYPLFAPWLEKILKLKRRYAAALGLSGRQRHPYDVLLDDFEEGMTTAALDRIFQTLKDFTIPFLARIQQHAGRVTAEPLTRDFDPAVQEAFARRVIGDCGFDFARGRLDVSAHPFCTSFSQDDVRITTRYEKNFLPTSLFGCLHEMGHALYEMQINPAYEATPLAGGISLGVHESQSRMWENFVGRSRDFWVRYYGDLQTSFPMLASTPGDAFYRSINRVAPTLIRLEADEITYNLHIIVRYEMEQELLEGGLPVAEAPARWQEKIRNYLGLAPAASGADRLGILQDIHWSGGGIGYFPTYTLGNLIAAQILEAARAALPSLSADLQAGRFGALLEWLRTNIHQFGKKYTPADLISRATGKPLTTDPYLRYLTTKFSEIYEL